MQRLNELLEKLQTPCHWKKLFGLECPGCGIQRAIIELLKGNIWESILIFPALLPLIASLIILAMHFLFKFKNSLLYFKISIIFTATLMILNFLIKLFF